ncbi:hypothetical protein CRG98_022010 [Punica granatum]|uniref:Uncharacterized protein n=1 Tax=Punica granatum TaxID=22663 RepID=A0A2I0JMP4_PUNGR|nr:hypothetical protein CRG98_022010 [Punica granatum]
MAEYGVKHGLVDIVIGTLVGNDNVDGDNGDHNTNDASDEDDNDDDPLYDADEEEEHGNEENYMSEDEYKEFLEMKMSRICLGGAEGTQLPPKSAEQSEEVAIDADGDYKESSNEVQTPEGSEDEGSTKKAVQQYASANGYAIKWKKSSDRRMEGKGWRTKLAGIRGKKSEGRKFRVNHTKFEESCAHPNFVSSGHGCARLNATRLGSVHLPGDAREKESPLPVYDPKIEGQ